MGLLTLRACSAIDRPRKPVSQRPRLLLGTIPNAITLFSSFIFFIFLHFVIAILNMNTTKVSEFEKRRKYGCMWENSAKFELFLLFKGEKVVKIFQIENC